MAVATSGKLTVYHTPVIEGIPYTSKSENLKTVTSVLNADMSSETATAVINWARGFIDISQSVYEYTKIEESVSLIEILNEE